MVEDSQGDVSSLANRAARLVEPTPYVVFYTHSPGAAQARGGRDLLRTFDSGEDRYQTAHSQGHGAQDSSESYRAIHCQPVRFGLVLDTLFFFFLIIRHPRSSPLFPHRALSN